MKYQSWGWRGLAMAVALSSAQAQAVRFNEIEVGSYLNEPLKARVQLRNGTPEELASLVPSLASANAFRAAGIDRSDTLANLTFYLGPQRKYLYIESNQPIREPFLLFLIRADWRGGSLTREYALLLDPPGAGTAARFELPDTAVAQVKPFLANPEVIANTPKAKPAAPEPEATPIETVAATATNVTEIIVKSGDTLSKIAKQYFDPALAPSADAFMDALFALNPKAFIRGDINLIRAGAAIQLPSLPDVPAATGPTQVAENPSLVEEIAVVESPDSDLTLITDNGIVEDAEAQFLRQRIQELELQLAQMQANNASRDDVGQLIAAQTGVALTPLAADSTPVTEPSDAIGPIAPVVQAPSVQPEVAAAEPAQKTGPAPVETIAPVISQALQAPASTPWYSQYQWFLAGGAALLLGLLAWVGLRRRSTQAEPEFEPEEAWEEEPVRSEPQLSVVPKPVKAAMTITAADKAEQALIYTAYGNAEKAMRLLQDGVESDEDDADFTLIKTLARISKAHDPDSFDVLVNDQIAQHPERVELIQFLSGIAGQDLAPTPIAQSETLSADYTDTIVLSGDQLDTIEFTLDIDDTKN